MAAHVSWYLENRIILIVMESNVTMEGVRKMNADIVALLEAGNPPVHVIFDASKMSIHPNKVTELVSTLNFLTHPNMGWDFTIAPSALVKFLGTVVNRLLGARQVQFIDTIEEAMQGLLERDESLTNV